ncbi:MAG: arylsulfatase [Burkholderiaceae bacterium]|nr:arylsulfatase [Burkholderiaceae bacterium]
MSGHSRRAALALLLACAGTAMAQPQRPNIVLLLADDWGFSDVGAFGGEIATPHLDELARRGMRFSNFHVTASCSPTRAMLLTGVDNHRNGVGNMRETIPQSHVGKPGYLSVLDRNVVTVASLLRDGGYRTYVAGKWHVGKEPHNLPPARGFDRSLVQGDSGSDNWETGKRYLDLTDRVYWYEDGKEVVMPTDFYSSQFYVDKTIEYLKADAAQAKPFFAYIGFQSNHIPLQAPAEFIAKYRGFYNNGWAALRQARRDKAVALGLVPASTQLASVATTTDWDALSDTDKAYQARRMEVYAAMAEAMDFHVGRLVAHLKATGAYDNTVFLFLSDNGAEGSDPYAITLGRWWLDQNYRRDIDSLGAKGAYTVIGPSWGSAATSPLSTYKFYAGEGGLRVPLIVAGVAGMPTNRIQPDFTHVSDIVPTLLDLAGVARPGSSYQGRPVEPLTGTSLLPVLTGAAGPVHGPDEPIGYELSGNQALFKGDLKLVKNLPPLGDGQWHLYDIRQDPGETRDLQQQRPEAFRAMQTDYAAYARANGVLPMPEGYEPTHQVLINALVNVYVPRLALPALALLGAIALLIWKLRRRRRQRRS